MYLTQIVRLNVFFLKKKIQNNKDALLACVTQMQAKNNPNDWQAWLSLIEQEHADFTGAIQPFMLLLASFIDASLSIDAWWSGIEAHKLKKHGYLDILISIVNTQINAHDDAEQYALLNLDNIINDDEYHLLQQNLLSFARALLNYVQNTAQDTIYTVDIFKTWIHHSKA
jgi:hypothetical protein